MRVYFACSITGGRQDENAYKEIVKALLEDGHEVPTAMNAGPDWQRMEELPDPRIVYTRDTEWIDGAQAMVAEVTTPSHGVGYEISYALERRKPVLCLFKRGTKLSKMITGNTMPRIQVREYASLDEAVVMMREFLAGVGK
ncbi:MAG: nucleoside 2-deoxyribosyltransferase [Anaerolineales bacterium]